MLEKVIELLATPEAWTRECFARTAKGNVIGPECAAATCFCVEGAIIRSSTLKTGRYEAMSMVRTAIREMYPAGTRGMSIPSFNDDPATTHEEVLAVLHRARELELAAT